MGRRSSLWILGALLGLGFLGAALARLDLPSVGAALARARIWPWLPAGVVSYLVGHGLRGMRLRRLVRREAPLTTGVATSVVVVGYAVNNVLPARLGELARAWMLMERSGLSFVQTFTVTAAERLLDAVALLVWLGVATTLLPIGPGQTLALGLSVGLVSAATLVLAIGVVLPGPALAVTSRLAHRWTPRAHDTIVDQVHAVLNGLSGLRRPGTALAVFVLTLAVWLCEAGLYVALLPAFALAPRPTHALFAMSVTNLGILVPGAPGFVGTFHFFCTEALVALGVDRAIAFAYAVLVHAAFFVPITLWGVAVLASHGLSVGRAITLSRSAEFVPAEALVATRPVRPPADPPPSRFLVALTATAVPWDAEAPPSEKRQQALRETAAFVEGQMRELPLRLRLALAIGLGVFRVATALRHGRGFCQLSPALRRAWFEQWAYGRWPLARQLFRAVRSTALLAWHEQPIARTPLDTLAAPVTVGGPR